MEKMVGKKPEQSTGDNRYGIILDIRHPLMHPSKLTAKLNLEPKACWIAGERRKAPDGTLIGGKYEFNRWYHSYQVIGERHFSRGITEILDVVENSKAYLRHIVRTGGTVRLDLYLPGRKNIGDILCWPLLKRFVDCRIDLGIEVFPGS